MVRDSTMRAEGDLNWYHAQVTADLLMRSGSDSDLTNTPPSTRHHCAVAHTFDGVVDMRRGGTRAFHVRRCLCSRRLGHKTSVVARQLIT